MANIRPDLVANRYAGLPAGNTLTYLFEDQAGIPVDGGKQLLRQLSPFRIKILPPDLVSTKTSVDVNLLGRANADQKVQEQTANEVRALFGIQTVSGNQTSVALSTLQRIVSAGQIVSGSSDTERAVFTDALTAADISYQVELILSIPALTLLVNPKEMSVTYPVVQQYQNRAREGFIFERWGEGQPTISFSGTTGGFIVGENPVGTFPNQTQTSVPTGIQWASRRESAAFQNFVALYQFYRNNGHIFDLARGSRIHHMVGALSISYDQRTYVGHITSFSYSYDQEMPNRLEWSMEFTADRIYDEAQNSSVVLPLKSPAPNPSYPSSTSRITPTSSGPSPEYTAGGFINVSGVDQYSETPLDVFLPSGIL